MNPTEAYRAIGADSAAGSGPGPEDPRVLGAVEEYLAALEAGRAPGREDFLARHAAIAERLVDYLDGLELIHRAGPAGGGPAGPEGPDIDRARAEPLGDFRLIREVGRGGMGVVYEAEQASLGRRVALKVLPFAATMDPRQLQRFHNEARAAASLDHPHIVHVHAVGCERGVHYYAMQFIDGRTLAALIAELRQASGRPAPPEEQPTTPHSPAGQPGPAADTAARAAASTEGASRDRNHFRRMAELGIQAAEALDHAHGLGIVHRDVKPANLLVDGRGSLWVTDFGLAHMQSDGRLTMTGDLVGTLRYMSPEQALAKRVVVDHRTDVYSLGATLYELLALEPVFRGNDRQELLRQIAFEEPRPPRQISKAIPADLETIVLKAIEKNPQDRYATAKELADDLRRFQEDRSIGARRPSLVQRLSKLARRHQGVVRTAVLSSVVLIAVLGSGLGWYFRDRSARQAVVAARVSDAVDESERLYRDGKVPEALAAARRAEGLLATGLADEALAARVRERVADFEAVLQIDDVLLRSGGGGMGGNSVSAYEQLFRLNGIDFSVQSAEEAAARIRGRFIAEYLAWALHDWGGDEAQYRRCVAVARLADPDPWRDRVRQAVERNDRAAVEEVARIAPVEELPPATLRLIGHQLLWWFADPNRKSKSGDHERLTRAFLRRAQAKYPGDVWLNECLGDSLSLWDPKNLDEAAGFYRVIVALRPNSPEIYTKVAGMLRGTGKLDEAITYYRKAIELDPKGARFHSWLADALGDKGLWDEALAEFREAIRLQPNSGGAHRGLGDTLANLGQWEKAAAEFVKATDYGEANANAWYKRALLCLHDGNLDGYRKTCADMLQRFGKADDLATVFWLAWTCVLAPDAVADAAQLVQLAQKAVSKEPKDLPCLSALGAALYRAGRFDDAAKRLTEASALPPNERTAMAYTWFFLAQAEHRLSHANEACRWLEKATRATEEALKPLPDPAAKSIHPNGPIGIPWNRKLTLQLLRREAEELIRGAGGKPRK